MAGEDRQDSGRDRLNTVGGLSGLHRFEEAKPGLQVPAFLSFRAVLSIGREANSRKRFSSTTSVLGIFELRVYCCGKSNLPGLQEEIPSCKATRRSLNI
jgi:hypothetical protein